MDNRTKNKFLAYARYIICGKFGIMLRCKPVTKQQGVESLLANIKMAPSGSRSKNDAAISITFLPAKDPMCG